MPEKCTVCKNSFGKNYEKHDIRIVYTKYSGTLILNFIETIVEAKFSANTFDICSNCFSLINELDQRQLQFKAARQKLTTYLSLAGTAEDTNAIQSSKTQKHVNPKIHECRYCLKRFVSESRIALHLKKFHLNEIAETDKNIKVQIGSDVIKDDAYLIRVGNKEEIEPSTDDQVFIKEECFFDDFVNIKADAKSDERTSKKNTNFIIPQTHQCSICEKTFKRSFNLKIHMSCHNSVKPFICEICGQAYKTKRAFEIHMGMHNGINPFTCVYCNKSFTQKGALKRHTPIHTGEAPYQCDLCGKRFVHHTSFHIHQLSHTGQKQYKCDICGLALFSGSHLKRHKRVHSGERNYACPVCDKRFAEKYNLVAHQRLHDNPGAGKSSRKSHGCQICGHNFEKRWKLEEHLVKEHQKVLDIKLSDDEVYRIKNEIKAD